MFTNLPSVTCIPEYGNPHRTHKNKRPKGLTPHMSMKTFLENSSTKHLGNKFEIIQKIPGTIHSSKKYFDS